MTAGVAVGIGNSRLGANPPASHYGASAGYGQSGLPLDSGLYYDQSNGSGIGDSLSPYGYAGGANRPIAAGVGGVIRPNADLLPAAHGYGPAAHQSYPENDLLYGFPPLGSSTGTYAGAGNAGYGNTSTFSGSTGRGPEGMGSAGRANATSGYRSPTEYNPNSHQYLQSQNNANYPPQTQTQAQAQQGRHYSYQQQQQQRRGQYQPYTDGY